MWGIGKMVAGMVSVAWAGLMDEGTSDNGIGTYFMAKAGTEIPRGSTRGNGKMPSIMDKAFCISTREVILQRMKGHLERAESMEKVSLPWKGSKL